MTFNIFGTETIEDSNEEANSNPPRSLSQAATDEILGENLCLLFAIGKNGEITRFYPYGSELPQSNQQFPEEFEEDTIAVEIFIKIPKREIAISEPAESSDNGDDHLTMFALKAGRRCCLVGGKNTPC